MGKRKEEKRKLKREMERIMRDTSVISESNGETAEAEKPVYVRMDEASTISGDGNDENFVSDVVKNSSYDAYIDDNADVPVDDDSQPTHVGCYDDSPYEPDFLHVTVKNNQADEETVSFPMEQAGKTDSSDGASEVIENEPYAPPVGENTVHIDSETDDDSVILHNTASAEASPVSIQQFCSHKKNKPFAEAKESTQKESVPKKKEKLTFPTIAEARLGELEFFDFPGTSKAYVDLDTGGLNHGVDTFHGDEDYEKQPLAFNLAEHIRKNYTIFASNEAEILFIYQPSKGYYEQVNERQFGRIMSKIFHKSNIHPNINTRIEKTVFHLLVNDYRLQTKFEYFDNQERFINVANGVVDLKDGCLKEHDARYGFLSAIDLDYNQSYAFSKKMPELFGGLVRRIFPGQTNARRFLQCFAYLISNCYSKKVAFYWFGPPNTGKSTCQRLLTHMIGDKFVANLPLHKFSDKFAIANLSDKKLNVCGETQKASLKSLETFKALVGNDYIDAEFKGKDHFSFRGHTKCLFAGNSMITLDAAVAEEAVFNRFEFLDFQQPLEKSEQIPFFEQILFEKEGMEILSVLIRVLRDWYNHDCKFAESKSSIRLKAEFMETSSQADTVQNFIEDKCELNAEAESYIRDLCDAYKKYCKNNGMIPLGDQKFIRSLKDRKGLEKRRLHHSRQEQFWGICGIALKC